MAGADDGIGFRPTSEARRVLDELIQRHSPMGGLEKGPLGRNALTETESALWAAVYEIRRALDDPLDQAASNRLAKVCILLTDGVLRSQVLSRGGVDWVAKDQ